MKSLNIKEIKTKEEFKALEPAWNTITKEKPYTIFQTFDWLYAWWENFGEGNNEYTLSILKVEYENEIIGIIPLTEQNNTIKFLGHNLSDYNHFIIKETSKEHQKIIVDAVFEYLFSKKIKIYLEEIPYYSPLIEISREVLKKKKKFFDISHGNDVLMWYFHNFDMTSLKKKLVNKESKKRMRRLREHGEVVFRKVTQEEALERLKKLFKLHKLRWEQKGQGSMFYQKGFESFFLQLASTLMPKGQVKMWLVSVDDEPVSIDFGFCYNDSYLGYCQAYDLKYQKASPGFIMWQHILENSFNEGIKYIDFSRGTESYKLRLSNTSSTNKNISVYRGPFSFCKNTIYHSIKEKVMRNAALHEFTIKLRAKFKKNPTFKKTGLNTS